MLTNGHGAREPLRGPARRAWELVERFEAPCGSLELDTGMLVAGDDYVLSASLLDDRGVSKTEEVASSPFSVKPGAVTRVDINFGADAWIDVDTDVDASP